MLQSHEKVVFMTEQKGKKVYIVLMILFIIGAVVSLVLYAGDCMNRDKAQDIYEELASMANEETETIPEHETDIVSDELAGVSIPEKNIDWNGLWAENGDIYAWIYVPGTSVDYPVVQHPTDDLYYLEHNLDGSRGYPGTIFSQSLNSRDFTDPNTVLYGHNMKNGSMFATLHKFEDNIFFDENMYIYIYTPKETLVYKIFAAYEFSNAHLLYNYDLATKEGYESYLAVVRSVRDMNAHMRDDVEVTAESRILTLSTCLNNGNDAKRYLVQGVLLGSR